MKWLRPDGCIYSKINAYKGEKKWRMKWGWQTLANVNRMKIQNTEYQRSGTLRRDLGASLQNSYHAIAMHAYIHAYCIGSVCLVLILWSRTMFCHIQYRVQLNTIYKKQSQKKIFVKGKRDFERSYTKKFTLLQCFREKLTHWWQN